MRLMVTIIEPPIDDFIDLSWRVNADDPHWIPPMRARLRQELSGTDAFGRYGRMQLFGCESNGTLVGRLAAIVNPRLTDAAGSVIGQVGYFEAVDDAEVATALFGAAFDWLRAAGAREVWGPMNGGAHRTHRLMTAGFDRDPFLFELRNPPYYPALFESAGFARMYSWYGIDVTAEQLRRALAELHMLQPHESTQERYEVVKVELANPSQVLGRLHRLLDDIWTGHGGYTSLDLAEFVEVFAPALSLMHEGDLQMLVDRESGRDVGCAFTVPDYGAEVRALNGDASGWGAWLGPGVRPRRLVLHTLGLAPEARRTGAAGWFLRHPLEYCAAEYEQGVFAMVIEEWRSLRKIAPVTREWALFRRTLD